jgi:hypothetical protein
MPKTAKEISDQIKINFWCCVRILLKPEARATGHGHASTAKCQQQTRLPEDCHFFNLQDERNATARTTALPEHLPGDDTHGPWAALLAVDYGEVRTRRRRIAEEVCLLVTAQYMQAPCKATNILCSSMTGVGPRPLAPASQSRCSSSLHTRNRSPLAGQRPASPSYLNVVGTPGWLC